MKKQKIGKILFWIAAAWGFLWGSIGSIIQQEFYLKVYTFEELSRTIFKFNGPLNVIWGLSVPLAAILAVIGILLYVDAKKSTVWKAGLGMFFAFGITAAIGQSGHHTWLYAVMGTIILLSFFGKLWGWAKARVELKGNVAVGADLKLVGYGFLLTGMWYTCAVVGFGWVKAYKAQPAP